MSLTFDLYRDVVAIVAAETTDNDTAEARSIHGTGFVIAPSVLMTCWHCVKNPLPVGHFYAAAYQEPGGKLKLAILSNISQDRNRSDLAPANLTWPLPVNLRLAIKEASTGEDVWTAGHPLTDFERRDKTKWLNLAPQYLRTYVTRQVRHSHPGLEDVLSYELATPAHPGLSGAPIIRQDSNEVVGVIYGNIDISRVVELAFRDENTGEHVPQLERIVSHGLAFHIDTLRSVVGVATAQMPLSEFIDRFYPKPRSSGPQEERLLGIARTLEARGARAVCPLCRKADLTVLDCISGVQVQTGMDGVFTIPGQYLVCFTLTCPNCGFMSLHRSAGLEGTS